MKIIAIRLSASALVLNLLQPCTTAAEPSKKVEKAVVVSRDPASVTLASLFKEADVVALVTVLAGDGEKYSDVVYEASVMQAYKGVHDHDHIYFGPFKSYSIGSEYVVALKRTPKRVGDLANQSEAAVPFPREAPYLRVMYEGYSVMDVSYTCVIPSCDWAVEVSHEQVVLPDRVPTVPSSCHNGASSFVWVKKDDFLAELSRIRDGK